MIKDYLVIFVSSFLVTVIIVPLVKKIGLKFKLTDKPNKRKQHQKAIVRIGGLSIYLGIFLPLLFFFSFKFIELESKDFLSLLFYCSSGFFIIGFIEDIFSISVAKRLFLQFLIASIVWSQGLNFNEFVFNSLGMNLGTINYPNFMSYLISVFWVVGVINAINWLDGLDGLAAGLTIISALSFLTVSIISEYSNEALVLFSLLGACLGFLLYNFYPSKIFMGDSGSYLIGTIIAIFSIHFNSLLISESRLYISFIPQLLILFIPIFDMTYVILSRITNGKSPFYPDRSHIHHRFLNIGFSHKNTVLLCYLISMIPNLIFLIFVFKI